MNKKTTYYFVGIKGTGMSAMALILHDRGFKVTGSDIKQSTFTQKPLVQAGIKILPFNAHNIHPGLTVIAGNSFTDEQPEIEAALKMGLKVYRYHQFLGKMIKGYTSIAVAGTHGKTSTTGLLSHVLSPIAPTDYLIGDGTGVGVKNARFFVYEADEYRRHFLGTDPDYAILNNIDFDHPDYYTGIDDYVDAFQTFADQVHKGIFIWGDDPNLRKLTAKVPIYTFGTDSRDDFQATNIIRNTKGSRFDAVYQNRKLGTFTIHLFGKYNILHALAVVAVAHLERVDLSEVKKQLVTFKGEKRRFAHHHVTDMEIIDDYAHHPSEIDATIGAARQQYPDKQLIVVFQPHTYSRTAAYLPGFAKSLSRADRIYVTKIYASPREKSGRVSSQDIIDRTTKPSTLIHGVNMKPLLKYHHKVVIFMGAGDIPKYEVAYEKLLKKYHK